MERTKMTRTSKIALATAVVVLGAAATLTYAVLPSTNIARTAYENRNAHPQIILL
jgi:hypothetical protein